MIDNGQSTRDILLKEFAHLCFEQGYEKTTMRQLGERCGMSNGNINYYFSKKSDMAIALFKIFSSNVNLVIEKVIGIPENCVTGFFLHFLMESFLVSHSPVINRLSSDMGNNAEYVESRVKLLYKVWACILDTAQIDFNKEMTRVGCICAGHSIYAMLNYWHVQNQAIDYQKFYQVFHEILLWQSGLPQLREYPKEAMRLFDTADKSQIIREYKKIRSSFAVVDVGYSDKVLSGMWAEG